MELRRNWKVHLRGPGSLALAVVFLFSPNILAALDREFVFGDWVGYALAAISLLSGIVLIAESRQRFAIHIDDRGIIWIKGQRKTAFAWDDVTRAGIEKKPNAAKNAAPSVLTVWTNSRITYDVKPDVSLDGLNGYRLADISELTHTRAEVAQALQRYGGERHPSAAS